MPLQYIAATPGVQTGGNSMLAAVGGQAMNSSQRLYVCLQHKFRSNPILVCKRKRNSAHHRPASSLNLLASS